MIQSLAGRVRYRDLDHWCQAMKRELRDLLWGEVAQLTFEVNSALRGFCHNVQEYDSSIPEIIRAVEKHEFPMIVIFPKDCRAGKLILHLIKHLSFEELGAKHGVTMNGKARGSLTRIVVNVSRWHEFKIEELRPVHESMEASSVKRVSMLPSAEATESTSTEIVYETKRLKLLISNKSFHSSVLEHILDLYERILKRDASYQSLKRDLEDSRESIRLLEEGIHFAQKNLEACERRVSAQKGQRNKANNRFATTIEALNLEASYMSANLKKTCGYSKMKLTKGQNRLEKDKLVLYEEKAIVANSAVKLAIFQQLQFSITKLNKLNSTESMRKIMCVILPLVIPVEKMRNESIASKATVAKLLGFNEISVLGKHVFEKSNTLFSSMQNTTNFEDAVLHVKRYDIKQNAIL